MINKTTKAYEHIQVNAHRLMEGVVVSLDPSIGSTSSMPGWATYIQGNLRESGTFLINPAQPVWTRLQNLSHHVRKLYRQWEPDVLVYEDIPAQRHGGGNAGAHASLLKAVGTILSITGPDGFVPIHPITWKRLAREGYVKGDEEDAIEIGWVAIEAAKVISQESPIKTRKARSKVPG